jgi:hypothetical protein
MTVVDEARSKRDHVQVAVNLAPCTEAVRRAESLTHEGFESVLSATLGFKAHFDD